jgi:hypothetical protein
MSGIFVSTTTNNRENRTMDDETKGKLVDGAIVAAKSAGYIGVSLIAAGIAGSIGRPHHGVQMMRVLVPRPINMWRNQRSKRAAEELMRQCIADGCFSYRGKYRVRYSEQNARWEYGEVDPTDNKMWLDGYEAAAEECMRQIDKL